MSTVEKPESWQPDAALVFSVRARRVPISQLSAPDRAWLVAALTVQGWTVAAIAAQLMCSLRLIQQIKAEDITKVALFALEVDARRAAEASMRHLEGRLFSAAIAEKDATIARLLHQRDAMLDAVASAQKGRSRGTEA